MMGKILITEIREEIYKSLINHGLFPEKQKGCHKKTRRRCDILNTDQHILLKNKTRRKNEAIA